MKILVTGSEGHLMQSVIPKLIDAGHDVIGVDNLSRHGRQGNINSPRYLFWKADASGKDMKEVFASEEKIDCVIQAAATIFGVGGFNKHRADILSKDLQIQSNMLNLSQEYGIKKFIYISSSMVYENCNDGIEKSPAFEMAPFTDYGLSKFVGERMCQAYAAQYGLDCVIWRPFNILNPAEIRESGQGYNHVYSDFIDELIGEKVKSLPIIGDGYQTRCFTWFNDVATIIANNLLAPAGTYNIGNIRPVTMRELATLIHDIGVRLGMRDDVPLQFHTTAAYKHDVRYRVPDMKHFEETFGHYNFDSLEEGLEECVQYYIRSKVKW